MSLRSKRRAVHRRVLVTRGGDTTDGRAARLALVLAPHPGDEMLGCDAVLTRKIAQGNPVQVALDPEWLTMSLRTEELFLEAPYPSS
jgi:hypothetical protein